MRKMLKGLLLKLPARALKHIRAVDNYYNGDHEIRYLKSLCDPARSSVDVGANIGVYTYFLRLYSSHVYAYEPVPELVDFLRESYSKRVTVVPCAVSDEAGKAKLVMPIESGREQHELSSIVETFDDTVATRSIEVETVRLDDQNLGTVGMIKIEAQRSESAVIEGAFETLREHKPNLIVAWAPLLADCDVEASFPGLFEIGYHGYFTFCGRLMSLNEYKPAIHSRAENYGRPDMFMNTNLVFSMRSIVG